MSSVQEAELAIVIVNWNSSAYVAACLESIYKLTDEVRMEVIVIDNASFDGVGKVIAERFPQVCFIQNETNLGFARANNLGAKASSAPLLLFLNPDTEVYSGAMERLVSEARRLSHAGVIGCRLLNSDGTFQSTCVQSFPTILNQFFDNEFVLNRFSRARQLTKLAHCKTELERMEVEMISGACMMIRREAFDRVGGFSPDYFMYAEDLDLCSKTVGAGLRNYYVNGSVVVHHGGKSSQSARRDFAHVMMRESLAKFFSKTRGDFYAGAYRACTTFVAILRLALLVLLAPFWLASKGARSWATPTWKWLAILKWGFGFTRWPDHCAASLQSNTAIGSGKEQIDKCSYVSKTKTG